MPLPIVPPRITNDPRKDAQLKNIIFDVLYVVVTQWDHDNKCTLVWSQRLGKDLASVYAAQNDAFSFLTNFFPEQGSSLPFVPHPAIRFSLHESPRTTIYGISWCRVSRRAFQRGMSQRGCCTKVGDAMAASSAPDEWTPFLPRFLPTIKRTMIIFTGADRDTCKRRGAVAKMRHRYMSRFERRTKTLRGGWMRRAIANDRKKKERENGGMALSVDTRGSLLFRETHHPLTLDRGSRKRCSWM